MLVANLGQRSLLDTKKRFSQNACDQSRAAISAWHKKGVSTNCLQSIPADQIRQVNDHFWLESFKGQMGVNRLPAAATRAKIQIGDEKRANSIVFHE